MHALIKDLLSETRPLFAFSIPSRPKKKEVPFDVVDEKQTSTAQTH